MADRKGRLEDRPLRIKAELFPYDACTVPELLKALIDKGFLFRYEVNGNSYLQITTFEKHQYPHIRESESTIPAPGKHRTSTSTARLNPESPILNPDMPSEAKVLEWFEKTWDAYPRKEGHQEAWRHYKKDVKTLRDAQWVARALEKYKAKLVKEGTEEKFIMQGRKFFLNWRDYADERRDIERFPSQAPDTRADRQGAGSGEPTGAARLAEKPADMPVPETPDRLHSD